jgi:two-component system NtrC family response regulator
VDCTNIPETLAESILFGHVRGAFTDASTPREGLFAQVRGGAVFLDEAADLDEPLQRSLLRVLQEKRFRPLGASREEQADFRAVAVTNKDVGALMESGAFRRDLFYRLAQTHIHLPPLRERVGDVALLAEHFLPRICRGQGMDAKGAATDMMQALEGYSWPGNVRELVNALSTAVSAAGDEPLVQWRHLPVDIRAQSMRGTVRAPESGRGKPGGTRAGELLSGDLPSLREFRESAFEDLESRYLDRLIGESGGDARRAMELADISRARLYQLLKKHGRRLK